MCAIVLVAPGGVGLSAAAWVLLPLCWILVVNGARALTSDAHYAAHGCVTGDKAIDSWIGELLSTIVLSVNMRDYTDGHVIGHHGRQGIGWRSDPDLQLMFLMGFETGRPTGWYWRRLLKTLVSPRYYLIYSWNRLRLNFLAGRPGRLAMAYGLHGCLVATVLATGMWKAYVLAWLVPMGPLYALSAALQFPSEHIWLAPQGAGERQAAFLRRLSHGRFFLAPAPRPGLAPALRVLAWIEWSLRMLPLLFSRFFVCISILPAHDYHHRRARTQDWPMEPYLRQRDIDKGVRDYREFYGLLPAYAAQFATWSSLPREAGPAHFTFTNWLERQPGRRPSARAAGQHPSPTAADGGHGHNPSPEGGKA